MDAGTALVLAVVAGVLCLLGLAIRVGGAVELIAGYDAERVTDEDALADLVGGLLLAVAALTAVVGALDAGDPLSIGAAPYWAGYLVFVLAGTSWVALRCRSLTIDA